MQKHSGDNSSPYSHSMPPVSTCPSCLFSRSIISTLSEENFCVLRLLHPKLCERIDEVLKKFGLQNDHVSVRCCGTCRDAANKAKSKAKEMFPDARRLWSYTLTGQLRGSRIPRPQPFVTDDSDFRFSFTEATTSGPLIVTAVILSPSAIFYTSHE